MARTLRVLASSFLLLSSLTAWSLPQQRQAQQQGIFEGSDDIGHAQRGSTRYDAGAASYEVRGGGADVWGAADDFRFTWSRVPGDAAVSADVHVDAPVTYRISKGMLMFRQSLDPASPYAAVSIHADGHITLQYRLAQAGETKDITFAEHNAQHLSLVRHGDTFTAYVHGAGADRTAPLSITVSMHGPLYVGLGVCSHNTDALQTVTFSKVVLKGATR